MVATLHTENGEIKIDGRTLAIILELIKCQEEINALREAKIVFGCSGKKVRMALTKWPAGHP